MQDEVSNPEDIALDDVARCAVMKVLHGFGMEDEIIVELLGDLGIDPVMAEEDLEQIKDGITPGDKPFSMSLKALATISVTGKYAKLTPNEIILMTELLGLAIGVNGFIVFTRGAVCYALSKFPVTGNIELDLDYDEVFGSIFRLILEPSLDQQYVPQDADELQDILLGNVDTLVDSILTANGYKANAADRLADGPLTRRAQSAAEDDA